MIVVPHLTIKTPVEKQLFYICCSLVQTENNIEGEVTQADCKINRHETKKSKIEKVPKEDTYNVHLGKHLGFLFEKVTQKNVGTPDFDVF